MIKCLGDKVNVAGQIIGFVLRSGLHILFVLVAGYRHQLMHVEHNRGLTLVPCGKIFFYYDKLASQVAWEFCCSTLYRQSETSGLLGIETADRFCIVNMCKPKPSITNVHRVS